MLINQANLSIRSRLLILIAKLTLPDVEKAVFKRGYAVTNAEMYCIEQDRNVANTDAFDHRYIEGHDRMRRNAIVNKVRRGIFNHSCNLGFVLTIVFSFASMASLWSVQKAADGFHAVGKAAQTSTKEQDLAQFKQDAAQLNGDMQAHKISQVEYEQRRAALVKRAAEIDAEK